MTYPHEDPWADASSGGDSGQPGTDVAMPSDYDTGLDDLGSDLSVPRLKIAHKEGAFVDPSDNSKYGEIFCVILGLVRQRVLFDAKVDPSNPEKPMCKSPDTNIGFPNLNPENAKKAFPWDKAKLDPSQAGRDEDGRTVIKCTTCHLKEWDSHPLGDKPWCSEQFTLPILFAPSLEELVEHGGVPALISMQKTAIKPTKNYLKTFQMRKLGAYTAYAKISLLVEKAADNIYSKPVYTRVGDTPQVNWLDWVEQFNAISKFLKEQRPPAPDDGSETSDARSALASTTPAAATQPGFSRQPVGQPVAAQVVQPATAPVNSDEDLPF